MNNSVIDKNSTNKILISVCNYSLIDNYNKDNEIKVRDLHEKIREEYFIEDLDIETVYKILEEECLLTGLIKRTEKSFYNDSIDDVRYKIDENSNVYISYKNECKCSKQQLKEKILKNEILKLREKIKKLESLNNKYKQQIKGLCITNNKRKKMINTLSKNK